MSDTVECFKIMDEINRLERAKDRKDGASYLENKGISFTRRNNGAHLIVTGQGTLVDFWPGTGRWISRNGKKGFGVVELAEFVQTSPG